MLTSKLFSQKKHRNIAFPSYKRIPVKPNPLQLNMIPDMKNGLEEDDIKEYFTNIDLEHDKYTCCSICQTYPRPKNPMYPDDSKYQHEK